MYLVLLIILELHNAITMYHISHFIYQQRSNWLIEHYKTLTFLLGKKLHQQWKDVAMCNFKQFVNKMSCLV